MSRLSDFLTSGLPHNGKGEGETILKLVHAKSWAPDLCSASISTNGAFGSIFHHCALRTGTVLGRGRSSLALTVGRQIRSIAIEASSSISISCWNCTGCVSWSVLYSHRNTVWCVRSLPITVLTCNGVIRLFAIKYVAARACWTASLYCLIGFCGRLTMI